MAIFCRPDELVPVRGVASSTVPRRASTWLQLWLRLRLRLQLRLLQAVSPTAAAAAVCSAHGNNASERDGMLKQATRLDIRG
jgi:hypothetical protein